MMQSSFKVGHCVQVLAQDCVAMSGGLKKRALSDRLSRFQKSTIRKVPHPEVSREEPRTNAHSQQFDVIGEEDLSENEI